MGRIQVKNLTQGLYQLSVKRNGRLEAESIPKKGSVVVEESELLPDAQTKEALGHIKMTRLG